jgi:16S rRNA (cytosine967-C5)-methyltransferase
LNQLQLNILLRASKAVTNGGSLVYSTCSWLVEENEAIVEQFLIMEQSFKLVSCSVLGSPAINSDTMFVATLKRL